MSASDEVVEELREALAPELQLLGPLGSGGMGDVFLARDPALKRNVAVKVLAQRLGLSPHARQRFAREAETAAAVAHPNVVPIYRVGTLPRSELGYIVMAHVDGPSLRELVPEGTVASESDVRRIMAEVASALAAAHARGVVHRDIKPANVLFDPPGGRFVVVDFGIAAMLNQDRGAGSHLTMEGAPVGTPEYMSPEQAAGDPVVDKSDVYSLGCLAYALLTGKPPFTGPTVDALIRRHLFEAPAPIRSHRSDLSADFAALVMRCLQKDPDQRPDAEEVTRALGFVRRATIEWPPPGLESLHRQGVQWMRATGRLAGGLLLFVLILGIHPAAARPCCADSPDRSPGWLLLKRLSMVTPIHFDDPDALAIWYFVLDAAFFVLLAALVPFAIRSATLVGKLVTGRRSGYPLPVLGRAAWDRHRDTGNLINLTGPYALVSADRQERQLRHRDAGAGALSLSFVLLIVSCLAWLGGALELRTEPWAGLLPFVELATMVAPATVAMAVYLTMEALDLRHRQRPRRRDTSQPLRSDVLTAWMRAAGKETLRTDRRGVAIRAVGVLTVAVGVVTVIVAAYALIAVFGASARFAANRAGAQEWIRRYTESVKADSSLPPLAPRTALALTASVPLNRLVGQVLTGGRMTDHDRRLLLQSVGPAFCLSPREVLFGIAAARSSAHEMVARIIGADPVAIAEPFDGTALRGGGLAGLRHRAQFCERYFGGEAAISPGPRPNP